MTAHKHAEMIKAKADNMELVAFCKLIGFDYWLQLEHGVLPKFKNENEYFLCHPKHAKECLHWLNGGDVENNISQPIADCAWIPFCSFYSETCEPWSVDCNFMRKESNFRIKPRKEKRWIAIDRNGYPASTSCKTKEKMMDAVLNPSEWQFIEIEREV